MTAQIIFKHVEDKNEVLMFTGSMTKCKQVVQFMKQDAAKHLQVGKWCNGGFCVMGMYYVEIREVN